VRGPAYAGFGGERAPVALMCGPTEAAAVKQSPKGLVLYKAEQRRKRKR